MTIVRSLEAEFLSLHADSPQIEHVNIDSVNEWAWKKRQAGVSWMTIKDALRTMQRVLSAFSKDGNPPFSQAGLAIPERDKLQMKIGSRQKVSFSWSQALNSPSKSESWTASAPPAENNTRQLCSLRLVQGAEQRAACP